MTMYTESLDTYTAWQLTMDKARASYTRTPLVTEQVPWYVWAAYLVTLCTMVWAVWDKL
jgi:hypothetical protein